MARPSKMGAGYDAWVLGLHATHVRVCTRALVCRGQGKGWVRNGAAHVIRRATGQEVFVERLLVVRVVGAGRRTWSSAFLFIAQKMKRSTTCPT